MELSVNIAGACIFLIIFFNSFFKWCTWWILSFFVSELSSDENSYALITGASDGIGEAMAIELARKNWNLILIGRSETKLLNTVKKIETINSGIKLLTYIFDFSSLDAQEYNKLEQFLNKFKIKLFVASAGVSYPAALRIEELDYKTLNDILIVNLISLIHVTKIIVPNMRKNREGHITFIGSGASELQSEPLYAVYAASKAGVQNFAKSLQIECAKDNISVQCQTPLLVKTKLSKIRKTSLTIPSASEYAKHATKCTLTCFSNFWTSTTRYAYINHALILCFCRMVPFIMWNKFRLKMTERIRNRYLMKLRNQ